MILTYAQINECCLNVIRVAGLNDPLLYDLFTNYYNTGLRARELLEHDRWALTFDNKLICTTEKGSLPRIFDLPELTERFTSLFISGQNPYQYNSFSTVNLYFQRWLPYAYIRVDTKNLGVNIFRHNKIKLMKNGGYSWAAIQQYFGEVNQKNILGYYNSEIEGGQ